MNNYNRNFKLKFEIKQIIFRNYDGFSHVRVKIIDSRDCDESLYGDNKDMLGIFPMVSEGDAINAICTFSNSRKLGKHLKVVGNVHIAVPRKQKDLAAFIKRKTKGIGLSTLEKLIEEKGLNIISILEKNPNSLIGVAGLSEKKIKYLREVLVKEKTYENLFVFLQSENIPTVHADKIYEKFGIESLGTLRRNPYHICAIKGIDFIHADKMANKLGLPYDGHTRVKSAILDYVDAASNRNGDLFVYRDHLIEHLNAFVSRHGHFDMNDVTIPEDKINNAINELVKKYKLVSYSYKDKEVVYPKYLHDIEVAVVNDLYRFIAENKSHKPPLVAIQSFVDGMSAKQNIQLAQQQKDAIFMALSNKLSVLTGGPGTGKTFTVNMIVKCIQHLFPASTFTLIAPTGKASNRMRELIRMPATTIHKAIGLGVKEGESDMKEKVIETDYVIVDESSMVDIELFHQLITHIGEHTNVLIVGDYEQLPSVGPGLVLRDLIHSNVIPCTRLEFIYRQSQQSTIAANAYKLLRNSESDNPSPLTLRASNKDFWFVEVKSEDEVRDKIVKQVDRLVKIHKESIEDICVLSPTKIGTVGTKELNKHLQERINPHSNSKPEFMVSDMDTLRVGDKVIHIKNNSELGVNNGDTGMIESIHFAPEYKTQVISVKYPHKDEAVIYKGEDVSELELAYAITVHKSQGSEYNTIIMPILFSHEFMLSKNLVYTAWTRAKKKVICMGQSEMIEKIARSKTKISRNSHLANRLKDRFLSVTPLGF